MTWTSFAYRATIKTHPGSFGDLEMVDRSCGFSGVGGLAPRH
jgi:hypothetical protein